MKIKFFCILFIFSIFRFSYAQNQDHFSILYLLPLQINASEKDINAYSTELDIYADAQFQMLDFWKGAQLALQEYDMSDKQIRVIVRDVFNNSTKIGEIFRDDALMEDVKLIIGPFLAADFAEAARFAKEREIPIINPFSTRTDFLTDNPYVYKISPSKYAAPQAIYNTFLSDNNHNMILWYDKAYLEKEGKCYVDYFTQNGITFKKCQVSGSLSELKSLLSSEKQNIIISLYKNESVVLNQMRLLSNYLNPVNLENGENVDSTTMIFFPKEWLKYHLLDTDFYGLSNLFYFSSTYIDDADEVTLNFQLKYIEQYASVPNTENFAYQGYDITKYFMEALLGHFTPAKLTASRYNFHKIPDGGFENDRVRIIQIKDYKQKEYLPN